MAFLSDNRFETVQLLNPREKPEGKVKIDTGHHIGKHVQFCMLMNERKGVPRNIAFNASRQFPKENTNQPDEAFWIVLRGELGVTYSISGNPAYDTDYIIPAETHTTLRWSEFTVDAYLFQTTSSSGVVFANGDSSTSSIYCREHNNESMEFTVNCESNQIVTSSPFVPSGWHHYVWRWKKGEDLSVFRDGVDDTTSFYGSTQNDYLQSSTLTLWLAAANGGSGQWSGSIGFIRIYDKKLTEDQVVSLYHNPYQYIVPE